MDWHMWCFWKNIAFMRITVKSCNCCWSGQGDNGKNLRRQYLMILNRCGILYFKAENNITRSFYPMDDEYKVKGDFLQMV